MGQGIPAKWSRGRSELQGRCSDEDARRCHALRAAACKCLRGRAPGQSGGDQRYPDRVSGSPNCVSSQAGDERHRIEPFATSDDPDATFVRLTEIIRRRADATVIDSLGNYLRVELRTTFFVDDAEFLLDRERRLIHLRSASRIGYSDLGLNRRRIEEIRRQLPRGE